VSRHANAIALKVPYTCPGIDAAIKTVLDVYRMANGVRKTDEAEVLYETLSDIEFALRSIEDDLEKLRSQNEDLRAYAISALEIADELERKADPA
jgi:hypothetical protein